MVSWRPLGTWEEEDMGRRGRGGEMTESEEGQGRGGDGDHRAELGEGPFDEGGCGQVRGETTSGVRRRVGLGFRLGLGLGWILGMEKRGRFGEAEVKRGHFGMEAELRHLWCEAQKRAS
ncbi:unnamed protein product [Linum trigynum]|uniref:Uncharacterized protein n=1 Tax=Linum trigynum TaxID=586398 RepID=A0AAV2FUF7_9ROSI